MDADEDLTAARSGDEDAFGRLVTRHRRELVAHCYRMLGSPQDAEDALQETLLAAWRGLPGSEGRSSLRTWLYRVATSVCLRQAGRRPRLLSPDAGPPGSDVVHLGEPVPGPVWLEPLPEDLVDDEDPGTAHLRRESVELAFVVALQNLPATQRAVLLLRDVLGYSAAETAALLETTPASVNSALQRTRDAVAGRVPSSSQQAELARLGEAGRAALVDRFVAAWERGDVPALLDLLTGDVRFTMPPLPAWFAGRADASRAVAARRREEDGGDVLVFGSRTLWGGLLAAGLVDELYVRVSPCCWAPAWPPSPPGRRGLRLRDTRTRPDSPNVVLHHSVAQG